MTTTKLGVVLFVVVLATGCKTAGNAQTIVVDSPGTPLSKEALVERLEKKGVTIRPTRDERNETVMKPNPLLLELVLVRANDRFELNGENYASFEALLNILKNVRAEREKNGVVREGTNEIDMRITLPANPKLIERYNEAGVMVEDFEKLVADLMNDGFNQIELSFEKPLVLELPPASGENGGISSGANSTSGSDGRQTISGGVLNGKAISLAEPKYPAAARAVRASGTVNVQVTIDENGDVVSATAVSGHPLLRASAVEAARASKFSPTMLAGKPVKVTGILVFNFKL